MNVNVIIPKKEELLKIAKNNYPIGYRKDPQRGTNCNCEMINYKKKEENIRLYVKKTFLKISAEKFEEEYKLLKSKLKNIIPNQGFVQVGDEVFVFCAPIGIKIDIFLDKNKEYILNLLKTDEKLLKQVKFFIKIFEEFLKRDLFLDLYGNENLIISDENKLYYVDSFLVFHQNEILKKGTIGNFEYLKLLVKETENI